MFRLRKLTNTLTMDEIRNIDVTKPKKKHPIERANIFSLAFFWYACQYIHLHSVDDNHSFSSWLIPYFKKGFKRELNEDDMYGPLKTHESKRLGDKLEIAWNYEIANKKDPSLWRAVLKVFSKELVLYGIFNFFIEFIVR